MTGYLIAAGFLIAFLAFVLLARAARPVPKGEADARTTFEHLPGFKPGEVHVHEGAAIGYDPIRNAISIWDKAGGARLVDPSGVSSWQVTPRIELFAKTADRKPFFAVAVIADTDKARWRDRLQAAFGGEKESKA